MHSLKLSACVELLFAEDDRPVPARVRAAARAGCGAVEFWTWRDKPLDAIADAAGEAGVTVSMMIVEPWGHLVDPARRSEFVAAVRDSAEAAARIGCRALVAVSGDARPGASTDEQDQAIVAALHEAAPVVAERGIRLLLEPLNTRRDHPGTYLATTRHGLDLVERVNRSEVGLLYDVYHAAMMGEHPVAALDGRAELVGHVHVADTNGRHEPGTGTIDWPRAIADLWDTGYRGPIGLEYHPTVDSARSIEVLRNALAALASGR